MKKLFILSATISLLLLLCACSQRTKRSEHEEVLPKTRLEAALAAIPHVQFDSTAMVVHLDLSREEAAALGISDEHYDELIESVESMNLFLQEELKRNPDLHVDWDLSVPDMKTSRAGVLPRDPNNIHSIDGLETDFNNEEANRGYWAPDQVRGIKFLCLGKSALYCIHVGRTYSMGTYKEQSVKTGSCLWNSPIEVDIMATNTSVTAFYRTSDPNGGRAALEWIPQ